MAPVTPEHVVQAVLRAVEARDHDRLLELYAPDIEFTWPPGLPSSGCHRGAEVAAMGATFAAIWDRLQPTEAERRLDEHIVAAQGPDVVVRYAWKAVDGRGHRFETDTLAHYQVVEGRFARARMYHFDLAGLIDFVVAAGTTGSGGPGR